MKTLIVYDDTGKIFHQASGSVVEPTGLPFLWVEIPQGKYVDCVDVSDKENPKVIPKDLPKTEVQKEMNLLALAAADLDAQREKDKTETQLAIADLAEKLLGGKVNG